MQIGKLRHRLVIQRENASQDSYGEDVPSWTTFATVWGSVEPLTGREYLEGKALTAEVTYRIRIRSLSGVTPEMRVSYDSRYFQIVSVMDVDERNREMILMCREFVG